VSLGQLILVAGGVLAGSVLASLLAVRMRVPSLLLFLGIGLLIGSDTTGWVRFSDYELARDIGIVALALILFDGGLRSGWEEIRPVLGPAVSLAIVGTALTSAVTGLIAAPLLGISTLEGLLLGAVLSSTDGAAVFALLRGSQLRRRLALTLEGESGFNDPIAVLFVVSLIELITEPATGAADVVWLLLRELTIGLAAGFAVGLLAIPMFRRLRLASAGLYPVATLGTAALGYGVAATLHGSGFLAVYLVGLTLAGAALPGRRTIEAFHDGLAWLAQVVLFVTLGLLAFPGRLDEVALEGTAIALVLVFIARPLAAGVAVMPFGFSAREKLIIGWAGLRGAVPVVLATFVVAADVPKGSVIFDIVFFAVVISTLLQGTTVEALARRLGLTTREPALPRPLADSGTIRRLGAEVLEVPVQAGDEIAGLRVRDLELPREAVVNVIVRGDEAIPPRGATVVRAGDELHVLVRDAVRRQVEDLMRRWRDGPIGPGTLPVPERGRGQPVFSAWPWRERDGDPGRPGSVRGVEVLTMLRIRRDRPGTLVLLADGRYAVTGRHAAIGAPAALEDWVQRRLRSADADERMWLQTVAGALAVDGARLRTARPPQRPDVTS
jgi:cell volume regulation protein A